MTYDLFSFFNECDLLEIRFNILDPYVDFFVLGESPETFSGKEKPLYYELNKERFARWNHKVIHIVSPKMEASNAFIRAGFQKENLKTGLKDSKDDDIVYYGDLDEIWKPKNIKDSKVYNLEQLNYCYYMNQRSSERWVGTIVGRWKEIKKNTFSYWRANHINELKDGGWHFTSMGGIEQIRKKLDAYDHTENDTLTNYVLIEDRMKDGEDYVGRSVDWEGKPFVFHIDESELPEYIISNKSKLHDFFKS